MIIFFWTDRGGLELRVWKAIAKWRREHRPSVTPIHNSTSVHDNAVKDSNDNRL